jgi:hypothetical protein
MSFEKKFKKNLTEFFTLHHPRQVKKVDKIAEEFKGNEVEVFLHLCRKYKVAKSKVPGLVEAEEEKNNRPAPTPVAEELPTEEPQNEEAIETETQEDSEEESEK